MDLRDRNKMLEILHKRGTKREHIQLIMRDLEDSGIFNDIFIQDEASNESIEWDIIEKKSDIIFSDCDYDQRIEALKNLNIKSSQKVRKSIDDFIAKRERIILDKAKKVEEDLSLRNKPRYEKAINSAGLRETEGEEKSFCGRYGRTPLHEAVVAQDLVTVELMVSKGLYVNDRDNSGHTASEIAYYEGYEEILEIFKKYSCKK